MKKLAIVIGLLIPVAFVGALLAQTSETFTQFVNGTPAAGTLAGTEVVPVVSGGATRQTTVQAIANLSTAAVSSFNTRVGAVTLTSTDVTTALGYTPLKPSNNLSDVNSPSTSRTNLGLGTAATQNTGTSGANLPFANGNNTWSNTNTYSGALVPQLIADVPTITSTTSTMGGMPPPLEVCVDTTSSLLTITLPASPVNYEVHLFVDCKKQWNTNNFILKGNTGQTVFGASQVTATTTGQSFAVKWYPTLGNWVPR